MICSVPGCDRSVKSKGLCQAHYFRQWRNSTVGEAPIKTGKPSCSVPGCTREHRSRGYCLLHGRRVAKGGTPDHIGSQAWHQNPAWKGDQIGYVSAHDRVKSARGPARDRTCAQCGGAAKHWAYTHDDPNALTTPAGIPYSADPARYEPLCVPCHKRSDLARCNSETGGALRSRGP